jgi:hypothetical protein
VTRTYRVLLATAKLHTPPKPDRTAAGASGAAGSGRGAGVAAAAAAAAVTQEFQKLAAFVNKELTPPLYEFLTDTQTGVRVAITGRGWCIHAVHKAL